MFETIKSSPHLILIEMYPEHISRIRNSNVNRSPKTHVEKRIQISTKQHLKYTII